MIPARARARAGPNLFGRRDRTANFDPEDEGWRLSASELSSRIARTPSEREAGEAADVDEPVRRGWARRPRRFVVERKRATRRRRRSRWLGTTGKQNQLVEQFQELEHFLERTSGRSDEESRGKTLEEEEEDKREQVALKISFYANIVLLEGEIIGR